MDSITNIPTSELQASESYFQCIDPINLEDVVRNDLQRWSIRKRSEEYLPVHHDGPFPLSDLEPFSSARNRDSICLYKERMAKHHQVGTQEDRPPRKLVKFDTFPFGIIAPSTTRLAKELKAYRRKLTEKSCEWTRQALLDLEAELQATCDLLRELRVKEPSTSEEGSSNKPSLASHHKQAICRKRLQRKSHQIFVPLYSAALQKTSLQPASKSSQGSVGDLPPSQNLLTGFALSPTNYLDTNTRSTTRPPLQSPSRSLTGNIFRQAQAQSQSELYTTGYKQERHRGSRHRLRQNQSLVLTARLFSALNRDRRDTLASKPVGRSDAQGLSMRDPQSLRGRRIWDAISGETQCLIHFRCIAELCRGRACNSGRRVM